MSLTISKTHMDYLQDVVDEDVRHLIIKERTYGGSWKKRGGVGAFMMLARKWDRIENMVGEKLNGVRQYDIFDGISRNPTGDDGTLIAEIRDLRRYLVLVEAEMIAKHVVAKPSHLTDEQKRMVEPILPDLTTLSYPSKYDPTVMNEPKDSPFGFQLENEIDTTRYPLDMTVYEYENMNSDIHHGSAKGNRVTSLYRKDTTGRYWMDQVHRAEYG